MLSDRISLIEGDITKLEVDAVVTAANESLLGGGGVDGAIHRAAGPGLLEECRTLGICNPGEARITGAYLLPAKYIVHTVGPIWEGGQYDESEILASCYKSSLQLASAKSVESIAFPCIATGVYCFPKDLACDIALRTVRDWLEKNDLPQKVIFCCFDEEDAQIYAKELQRLGLTA